MDLLVTLFWRRCICSIDLLQLFDLEEVYKFSLLPGLRQPCRDPHRGGVHRVLRQWSHLQVGQVGHRGHREIFGRRSQWGKVQALCWRDVVVPTFWRWKKWKNINLLLTVWWLILFFFPIHFEKPATIGWLFNKKKVLYIFPGKKIILLVLCERNKWWTVAFAVPVSWV